MEISLSFGTGLGKKLWERSNESWQWATSCTPHSRCSEKRRSPGTLGHKPTGASRSGGPFDETPDLTSGGTFSLAGALTSLRSRCSKKKPRPMGGAPRWPRLPLQKGDGLPGSIPQRSSARNSAKRRGPAQREPGFCRDRTAGRGASTMRSLPRCSNKAATDH
jgi:hypothetical protein